MPIQLSIEAKGDYLRFEVSGERVPGELATEMLKVWSRVADACRESGHDRVLGINRLTGPPVTLELYRIGTELPAILGGVTRKVAFVVLGDRESVRGGLFVENVTMNRGIYSRVFEDEALALAWLLDEA